MGMKQHLSVLMLLARSTICRIAVLFVLSALVQGGLFYAALRADPSAGLLLPLESSRVSWVFGVCFLLVTALLCFTGCEFGSRQGYTLRRLSLPENRVFLWQWGYSAAVYFLLWAAQLFTALGLCALYLRLADPAQVNGQTVFLAFYRSGFLHALFPLEDAVLWVRNLVLCLSLGAAAAHFPFRQRRGKRGFEIILLAAAASVFFPAALGSFGQAAVLILLAVSCTASCVYLVFRKEENPYAD